MTQPDYAWADDYRQSGYVNSGLDFKHDMAQSLLLPPILEIRFESWKSRRMFVCPRSETDLPALPIFEITAHMRKPQMRFFKCSPGVKDSFYSIDSDADTLTDGENSGKITPPLASITEGLAFATTTFHYMSPKIDIEVNDTHLELTPSKMLATQYKCTSPSFNNHELLWVSRSQWKSLDYVCLDHLGLPIARYTTDSTSNAGNKWYRFGRIEFDERRKDLNNALMDEIVVMGLALSYRLFSNRLGSATASSAAAAGGAAA